jgi:hypothetical protein
MTPEQKLGLLKSYENCLTNYRAVKGTELEGDWEKGFLCGVERAMDLCGMRESRDKMREIYFPAK